MFTVFPFICTQLMETSGTEIISDTDVQAPLSPLHLAVSRIIYKTVWTNITMDIHNHVCGVFFKAYHGHHQALEVLVQSLLDLDVKTLQGYTPLYLAAFKGHVECVDVLINQGASILLKDYTQKRTPIHAAGGIHFYLSE